MIFIVASILIQLACAVHIVRNGRNPLWLTVVILLSIPGCLAYFFVEVLPSQRHNRSVRAAGQIIAKKVDPERHIRTARERLEIADTAANHSLLGDALTEAGRHAEAVPHYEAAIERQPAAGRGDLLKLAASLIESGRAERALDTIAQAPPAGSVSAADQQNFLKARALEAAGRREDALGLYRDLTERLPGEEALCRYAALALELGHRDEAKAALEKVEFKARRLSRIERAGNAEMHDWAARTLADLRG
jgi:hypothetical protein